MTSISKKLFKGSVLNLVTLIANIAVGFIMMPFLIHRLGDDQYGIWIIVGAIIGFYGLLDAGMGGAINRFLIRALHSEDSGEVNVALSSSFFLFGALGLLSAVITVIIIASVPYFIVEDVNRSLVQILIGILGLKVAVIFPLASFGGILVAKYRFDIVNYVQMISLVTRTALIIFFVSNDYSIVSVAVITAFDALGASLLTVYFAKKLAPEIRVSWSLVSIAKLRSYYDYGKYTYVATIADRVRFSIDNFVVAAMISVGAVTHYTIAVALFNYYGESMARIFGVISPVLNKYHKLNEWDKLREVFLVVTELSAMMSVLIGGSLIVLGEPFINLWMGESYGDAYMVLVILCCAGIVAQAQRPSVAILYAIAKHKYYAKITSIEAIANICISIILVEYIGIYGVALGTTLPLMVNKLYFQPVYTCKQLELPIKSYCYSVSKYFILGIVLFSLMYIYTGYIKVDAYYKLVAFGGMEALIYIILCLRYVVSDKTTAYLKDTLPDGLSFFLRKAV